ncbi:MAG: SGNH/GDSL hydrolase family protein, partial [Candidatus Eisenbacteria bacterium]|nr:SGNH/GDSL hydrolase family protein [Candidatus Eisenbacteria bacterium]
ERFLVRNPVPGVRHGFVRQGRWKFCYPAGTRDYFEPGGCVLYGSGPHGYRFPEGLWQKPQGRRRVLIIGDSVSFGIGVPSDSMYSRHLERRLRRHRPNLDVVNMGVIGYMASEGISILVHETPKRSPDLVVWQLHINDLIAMEGWAPTPVALSLPDSWRKGLKLVSLIERRLTLTRHVREMEEQYGEKVDPVTMDSRTEDFIRAAEWAGNVLAARGLPCVAMLYPYPDFLGGKYPFMGLHRLFERECRRAGIVPLDLLPTLRRIRQDQLWVDQSDNHPSARGHRAMADALERVLTERFGPGLESIQPR